MIYRVVGKRCLDIIIVFISVLLLSPIMILIALLIKFFDPGPIFFKQQRVGRNGVNFCFYKFRSMPVNTGNIPSDKIGKIKLTWIGRVIRRTNLDELPQLLNILKGDMSIVGPRPPIPNQLNLIELRKSNGAIKLRPGLTGLAQIKAFDGMSVCEKADYDEQYVKELCFSIDIKIILGTFTYLLKPPPVY
ncbi:sugar transferase [Aliikangiella sp. IMCC44359]|uniref:sugar transferase n=1 Tax=Aliikangiella sp. IMCC44359 TaxID=3459125 RepID=UPI00403B345F